MLVSGPNQKTLTAAALTDSVKAAYTWLRGELRSAGILADSRPAFVQYPSNETNQHLFVKVTELVKGLRCLIDWVVQHVADHANPATDIDEKVRVSDEDEIARRLGMKLVTPEVSPLTTFEEPVRLAEVPLSSAARSAARNGSITTRSQRRHGNAVPRASWKMPTAPVTTPVTIHRIPTLVCSSALAPPCLSIQNEKTAGVAKVPAAA